MVTRSVTRSGDAVGDASVRRSVMRSGDAVRVGGPVMRSRDARSGDVVGDAVGDAVR